MFDIVSMRKNFSIYKNNPNLVYLDTGATSLKPDCVLDKMNEYYTNYGVNIHRGVYKLSYQASNLYDEARDNVSKFINSQKEEVIFVKNATEALNLVSLIYQDNINEFDEIITCELEHHSSFLPWLEISKKKKAILKFIELDKSYRVTIENFKKVLSNKTKVVCLNYYSNVLGYKTPIEEIIKLAHEVNAIVIVDASQAVAHTNIDVKKLDCDFLAFSSHKMMGPTGLGVLYGKYNILKKLKPLFYGGDMNEDVFLDNVTIKNPPERFESGTPPIAEVLGLNEAIKFIQSIGYDNIKNHTKKLYDYTISKLKDLKGLKIYNTSPELPIIAFNILDVHPHDIATIFDDASICLRAGHHCAQLLSKVLNCNGTLRASFYIYNDLEDCDKFITKIKEAIDFFSKLIGEDYE